MNDAVLNRHLFVFKDIRVDPADESPQKSDDEDDGNNELDDGNNELQNTTTEDDVDITVNDSSEVNCNKVVILFVTGFN